MKPLGSEMALLSTALPGSRLPGGRSGCTLTGRLRGA